MSTKKKKGEVLLEIKFLAAKMKDSDDKKPKGWKNIREIERIVQEVQHSNKRDALRRTVQKNQREEN